MDAAQNRAELERKIRAMQAHSGSQYGCPNAARSIAIQEKRSRPKAALPSFTSPEEAYAIETARPAAAKIGEATDIAQARIVSSQTRVKMFFQPAAKKTGCVKAVSCIATIERGDNVQGGNSARRWPAGVLEFLAAAACSGSARRVRAAFGPKKALSGGSYGLQLSVA
jgi:hypothetical protein